MIAGPRQDDDELDSGSDSPNEPSPRPTQIVKKGKLILYNRVVGDYVDESVVSVKRYNSFGASLFPGTNSDLQLTAGITSASSGDGKTTVAANLATFLAIDSQDDTVLVDLNFLNPSIHKIFGVPAAPGVIDSIFSDTITISQSAIKGLWILPLGKMESGKMSFNKILELRETLATLKRQFRFVIVDLPPALHEDFPAMVSSHLEGFFLVINNGLTTKTQVSQMMNRLNENKVIGFIMNRSSPNSI